jgi:hypothetical protein
MTRVHAVSPEDLDLFYELRGLRNQIEYIDAFQPSQDAALRYIDLVTGLQSRLEDSLSLTLWPPVEVGKGSPLVRAPPPPPGPKPETWRRLGALAGAAWRSGLRSVPLAVLKVVNDGR